MTEVLHMRNAEYLRLSNYGASDKDYYDDEYMMKLAENDKMNEIWVHCNEITKYKLYPGKFHENFSEYCIHGYSAKATE